MLGCPRSKRSSTSATAASCVVQTCVPGLEERVASCMLCRTVCANSTRRSFSQCCRRLKDGWQLPLSTVARAGKSSSSMRSSGCRTRESATKSTPGVATAALSFTTALSRVMPCAFQGVSAQPRTSGNCVRVISFSCGSRTVLEREAPRLDVQVPRRMVDPGTSGNRRECTVACATLDRGARDWFLTRRECL